MKIRNIKQERLPLLLLKNTIAIFIPAVIVFIVLLGITTRYPILTQMACHDAESIEEVQNWQEQECSNVRISIPQMKYTGYDYYEDGKQTGAYYYSFFEEQCVFFLIKTKEPEPVLENQVVKGKVLDDSASLDAMKHEFAKELGLEYEAFNAFVNPLLISEVDYPYLETALLLLAIIVPYIVTGLIILCSIFWILQPYRHPSVRQLSEFGDRRLVYEEICSQMKNRLVQHNFHYYVTEEYLVISNLYTTDFIRIDYIRYISRHIIQKKKKQVYRLTMSNPEKMFYEKDFDSEICAEEIMAALIRLNPQIDDRTMKVFDLAAEESEEAAGESEAAADEPDEAELLPEAESEVEKISSEAEEDTKPSEG